MKTEIPRRAFSFGEFAQMFSISIDSAKRLSKIGALATITLGGRRLIPISEVERAQSQGVGTPRQKRNRKAGL
jgi:hypothetical protein